MSVIACPWELLYADGLAIMSDHLENYPVTGLENIPRNSGSKNKYGQDYDT